MARVCHGLAWRSPGEPGAVGGKPRGLVRGDDEGQRPLPQRGCDDVVCSQSRGRRLYGRTPHRDGARGMLAIRKAGGGTLAQDEETSVVYGMPWEARAVDGAEVLRPIGQVAHHLILTMSVSYWWAETEALLKAGLKIYIA